MYIKIMKLYYMLRNFTILGLILYAIFWAITHHTQIEDYIIHQMDKDFDKYFWLINHKIWSFVNGFVHFWFYSVYYAPTVGNWLFLAEKIGYFFYLKYYFWYVVVIVDPEFSYPIYKEAIIQSIPVLYDSFLMYLYTYFKDITRDFRNAETWPEKIWSVCKMLFFLIWRTVFFVVLITKGWYEYYLIDWYKDLEYLVIMFYRLIRLILKYLIGK